MLELIFIIWLISRIFRPRWGYRPFYRPYYRPFFGLGWGLPLFGLFMADPWIAARKAIMAPMAIMVRITAPAPRGLGSRLTVSMVLAEARGGGKSSLLLRKQQQGRVKCGE